MDKIQFCPYCGNKLTDGPYCSHCGKRVLSDQEEPMAQEPNNEIVPSDVEIKTESTELQEINEPQTLVDEERTPAYKPSKEQTNIAYFVVGITILSLIIYFAYWKKIDALSLLDDYDDEYFEGLKSAEKFIMIGTGVCNFLMLICFGLIYRWSCNKAVKIATGMGVFLHLLAVIKQIITFIICTNPDDYSSQTHENVNLAFQIHLAVDSLLWIYVFYLYVKNSSMSTKTRSWVALLAIFQLFGLFYGLANLLAGDYLDNIYFRTIIANAEFDEDISPQDFFYWSMYFRLYYVFILLLSVYGLWRLFRSEAFSGNYDEEASTSYSPFNRWIVMAIVSAAVIGSGLYFYYIEYLPDNFNDLI